MLMVYDEQMIKNMNKDELREALRNVQNLACAQDEMIGRQGEALMSYKCLLDDVFCVNNFRSYVADVTEHLNQHGANLCKKYAEPIDCDCVECQANDPA